MISIKIYYKLIINKKLLKAENVHICERRKLKSYLFEKKIPLKI